MQLFYCKDISATGFCTLDAEESRHAVKVLRLREGDELNVTDGCGNFYRCHIVQAQSDECVVVGDECVSDSSLIAHHSSLHLAVAPTKNPSRMEWLVEKSVEIGVGEITLLHCDHSERSFLKTDRLEKLAISAMKQSLHTVLPKINPAVNLHNWLKTQLSIVNRNSSPTARPTSPAPRWPPPCSQAWMPWCSSVPRATSPKRRLPSP